MAMQKIMKLKIIYMLPWMYEWRCMFVCTMSSNI